MNVTIVYMNDQQQTHAVDQVEVKLGDSLLPAFQEAKEYAQSHMPKGFPSSFITLRGNGYIQMCDIRP